MKEFVVRKTKEHRDIYFETTGIDIHFIDNEGVFLKNDESLPRCAFCENFDSDACVKSRKKAGEIANWLCDGYMFFCPAGFTLWASPVNFEGEFVGSYISEAVLMDVVESYVEEIVSKYDYPIEKVENLKNELLKMKVLSSKRVRHLSNLLYILSKEYLADEAILAFEKKNQIKAQKMLNEEIDRIKHKYKDNKAYQKTMELEILLANQLKAKDTRGARQTVNELLGLILLVSGGDIEAIKCKWFELVVIISRNVMTTLNKDEVFGLNISYLKKILTLQNPEEVYLWMTNILNRFISYLENQKGNSSYLIEEAKKYIVLHCFENITLNDVADNVYLSPSYLSRVFKKETGTNFIDFLNKVKIEQSLLYVKDLKYEIVDISQIAGFTDQSYYTKVFKKVMGVSPKVYRKTISS